MPQDGTYRKNPMKRLKTRPKAVILDMDGVIVDSMPYHFIAWYEALRPMGIRLNCFDVYSREGENWEKSLKDLLVRDKVKPTPQTVRKIFLRRQMIFKKYFRQFIFKGVKEFLGCLKQKGYRLGLVTGTPMNEIRHILPESLARLFDCIVSGDKVHQGKPNPEGYLKAREQLGLKAQECVVIENAPLGIKAAKRAGLFCFALTTSLPKEYLKEADIVVDRLEEITGFIEKTCNLCSPRR